MEIRSTVFSPIQPVAVINICHGIVTVTAAEKNTELAEEFMESDQVRAVLIEKGRRTIMQGLE